MLTPRLLKRQKETRMLLLKDFNPFAFRAVWPQESNKVCGPATVSAKVSFESNQNQELDIMQQVQKTTKLQVLEYVD